MAAGPSTGRQGVERRGARQPFEFRPMETTGPVLIA